MSVRRREVNAGVFLLTMDRQRIGYQFIDCLFFEFKLYLLAASLYFGVGVQYTLFRAKIRTRLFSFFQSDDLFFHIRTSYNPIAQR